MARASDYPVSFPFGATSAPYTPQSPHKGDDRAMPTGTPVYVNNYLIGFSGNTGDSTGSHLHIGRFVNGQATNPCGQGFGFVNAIVTQLGSDGTNGNYVRVQADGASWVYLHLSRQTVSVGQVLSSPEPGRGAEAAPQVIKKDDTVMNDDEAKDLWRLGLHREPENDQVWRPWSGHRFSEGADTFRGSSEWLTQNDVLLRAYPEAIKALDTVRQQLTDLQNKPPEVLQAIATATQASVNVTALPANDASLIVKFFAFLQRLIDNQKG